MPLPESLQNFPLGQFLQIGAGGYGFVPLTSSNAATLSPEATGVIDATSFAINRLLPADKRFGDLFAEARLNNAAEGAGIPIVFGPSNAVPGQWLWASNIWNRAQSPQGFVEELLQYLATGDPFQFFAPSILGVVGISMSPIPGSRALALKKIWTNGRLAWDENTFLEQDDITATGIDLDAFNSSNGNYNTLRIEAPLGGTDLLVFHASQLPNTTITGYSTAGNNLVNATLFRKGVVESGANLNGTYIELIDTANNAADDTNGDSVTITQNILDFRTLLTGVVWNNLGPDPISINPAVVFHPGNTSEMDLALQIEMTLSGIISNNVDHIGYRQVAWVWFDMNLKNFSSQVPSLRFEIAEVSGEANNQKSLSAAIGDILKLGGFSSCEFDTSSLSGNLRGYVLTPPLSIGNAIRPILEAHNIAPYEIDGKLKFIQRGAERVVTIPESKLAAHEEGQDAPRPFLITEDSDFEQPTSVTVKYYDADMAMNNASETERRHNVVDDVDRNLLMELPLTLTSQEARSIAHRSLWNAWQNRTKVTLRLPPRYLYLHEQDIVRVTINDRTYNITIVEMSEGNNWLIEATGFVETYSPTFSTIAGQSPLPAGDDLYVPPFTVLYVNDLAPVSNHHIHQVGVYHSRCALDPNANWQGSTLWANFTASDVPANYVQVDSMPFESTMGVATTTLAAIPVKAMVWDRTSTVTVHLYDGFLFSQSEATVLSGWGNPTGLSASGINLIRIGNEIFAFATATQNTDGTWTLSTLLRGLRNTQNATHAASETCNKISSINNSFLNLLETAWAGQGSIKFRVLPTGGSLINSTTVTHTLTQGIGKPFTVASLQCFRGLTGATNNDILIKWFPRIRRSQRMFRDWYLDEDELAPDEQYKVRIKKASDSSLLRDTVVTLSPIGGDAKIKGYRLFTYTEAMQTSDGLTLGNQVKVTCRKVNSTLEGREDVEITI